MPKHARIIEILKPDEIEVDCSIIILDGITQDIAIELLGLIQEYLLKGILTMVYIGQRGELRYHQPMLNLCSTTFDLLRGTSSSEEVMDYFNMNMGRIRKLRVKVGDETVFVTAPTINIAFIKAQKGSFLP